MILLKPFAIAIFTAITALNTHAESDDDLPTLHFFDEEFAPRLAPEEDELDSLIGTRVPRKCRDDIAKGKLSKHKECMEWMKANPGFTISTREPTMEPTPFFHVSSSFKDDTVMQVKLKPMDDTFIEVWRNKEALGHKEKLKIDAIDGIPTKVIFLKFALGHILREYHEGDTQGRTVTLSHAKLRLFAITDSVNGGYIEEIGNEWDEETAVWDDYVHRDRRGSYAREAFKLLPEDDSDVIGTFGNITLGDWHEADLTKHLVKLFDEDQEEVNSKLSLRLTTDSSDGVIYASKEYERHSPEMILEFTFSNALNGADLDESMIDVISASPTVAPMKDLIDTLYPSISPAAVATHIPIVSSNIALHETMNPTVPLVTKSPVVAETPFEDDSEEPTESIEISFEDSTISVVSSSFEMTITAIEELFRKRQLRHGQRNLSVFMSATEKEGPALKTHLLKTAKLVLENPPVDIMVTFEDELVVETVPKSNSDGGGVIRTSIFRIVGDFIEADVQGTTTAQLAALLDQTIIDHAFVGFQKKSFLEILSSTGSTIYSKTASKDVSITKVQFSSDNNPAFSTDNDKKIVSQSEDDIDTTTSGAWIQPTLIAGAALLFVATSSAALLVFRLKNNSEHPSEIKSEPTSDESPRSLEETAAPSTPSPVTLAERWKKKKFDYTEFHDDPDAEDSACAMSPTVTPTTSKYLDSQPARDIKFSQFMNTSFEDSSISDVSVSVSGNNMLGAKGSMNENGAAKEESSRAESYLMDTTMESAYNMETMSDLNARLENVLQLDGASPHQNYATRIDEDSHMTVGSHVPSELYSDINTSTDSPVQPYDYGTGAAYASHLITLDMIKNMPPPPSDAESDTSSYQEGRISDSDQNVQFQGSVGDLIIDAKSHELQDKPFDEESRAKNEMIDEELTNVMMLLKTPSKHSNDGKDCGSPESSAEIYIQSESDTESASIASSASMLDVSRHIKEPDVQQPSNVCAQASDNIAPSVTVNDGVNVLVDVDFHKENDPLQEMNVALNECIKILDKAAARE